MAEPLAVLTAAETRPVEPPVRSAVRVMLAAPSPTEGAVLALVKRIVPGLPEGASSSLIVTVMTWFVPSVAPPPGFKSRMVNDWLGSSMLSLTIGTWKVLLLSSLSAQLRTLLVWM